MAKCSTTLRNAQTVDDAVAIINAGTSYYFTPGKLAGQYAYCACLGQRKPTVNAENIEEQLEYLRGYGGIFDAQEAMQHALALNAERAFLEE